MSQPAAGVDRVLRYWHTVRHLRPSQVFWRLRRHIASPQLRTVAGTVLREPGVTWQPCLPKVPGWSDPEAWWCHGRQWQVPQGRPWAPDGMPPLQRYHLNYLDDLTCEANIANPSAGDWLARRWLEDNRQWTAPVMDPYVLSRRILNLCKWRKAGAQWSAELSRSVAAQADLLARTVERDVLGNHIIANAVALIFAGEAFDGAAARRWRHFGTRLLLEQVEEQVLDDGGHSERSPMYHAVVLEDLLDVLNLSCGRVDELVKALHARLPCMLNWLAAVTLPDGAIALFNDSTLDGCRGTSELIDYAARLGVAASATGSPSSLVVLLESGYVRGSAGPWTLIADVGDVGPPEQPGHAHADTLSFELALGAARLFVDPGTSTYDAGDLRNVQRGTQAHNTVCVDRADSSEVWGAFRTARRARARVLEASADGSEVIVCAEHDGYRRLSKGVIHRRRWRLAGEGLIIDDWLEGEGVHDASLGFLLHPDVRVRSVSPQELELTCDGRALRLRIDPPLALQAEPGCWYPRFGEERPTQRIVGAARVAMPWRVTTRIFEVGGR